MVCKLLTQSLSFFGRCPPSKLKKPRRLGSRLHFRLQTQQHLTWWTP